MPDLIRHPVPRPDESREPSQTLGPGFQIEVRDKLHQGPWIPAFAGMTAQMDWELTRLSQVNIPIYF